MSKKRRPTPAQYRLLCSIQYGWSIRRGFKGQKQLENVIEAVKAHGWAEQVCQGAPMALVLTVAGRRVMGLPLHDSLPNGKHGGVLQ